MKSNTCLCLVAACLSGCLSARPSASSSFLHLAGRNFCEASSACVEEQVFKHAACKYAAAAYHQACKYAPEGTLSQHYKDGFVEGYIDYLDAGGSGEPPAMGPFRFQAHQYQTVEGRVAIQDWFTGFRHGASVARESGFRDLILVPVSALPINPPSTRFYLPPGGELPDGPQKNINSVPPSAPSEVPEPAPEVGPKKDDPVSKARRRLPEPMSIILEGGGAW